MLAGKQGGTVDRVVAQRWCEVQDQLNVLILNQLVGAGVGTFNIVPQGFCLGFFKSSTGTSQQLDGLKTFEIIDVDVTDISETNNTDFSLFHRINLRERRELSIAKMGRETMSLSSTLAENSPGSRKRPRCTDTS